MSRVEQEEIRALAREFAGGEIRPFAGEWDGERALPEALLGKLVELGFMGIRIPEEEGGLGLDLSTYLAALEELAWGDAATALLVAIQNGPVTELLRRTGREADRAHLPALASGSARIAWAVPAPGTAHSDRGVRARREGEGWVLEGEHPWVVEGGEAHHLLVGAEVEGEGTGVFLVEGDREGIALGSRLGTLGLRSLRISSLRLDGVELPEGARLPLEGATDTLLEVQAVTRLGLAAIGVGLARSAAEHALGYAQERSQFGRAIAAFEAIQEKLGGMATRISAAGALLYQAAERVEEGTSLPPFEGGGGRAAAAMARLVAGETAEWVASEAVQIFGGYGYMRHYPVERHMRDAQAVQILEGTVEQLRLEVARTVLGGARGEE